MNKEVAIITGANGGMGSVITKTVAKAGYEVVMACKDMDKAKILRNRIAQETGASIILLELNLASFDSIQNFTNELKQRYSRIKLLLNNAGTLCHHPEHTVENIEMTIGVNYLGHYLLSHLLLPLLGNGSRVVNMVSLTYKYGKITPTVFHPIDQKHFNRFRTYSDSKRAFFYFTMDAAEAWKEKGISVNCADPGIVNTNIICMGNKFVDKLCDLLYRPVIKTPVEGAATLLKLALSPEMEGKTGLCCANQKETIIKKEILTSPERDLLRKLTTDIVKQYQIDL
ncbi:MAG: SDR family NAD(P)-dependent oxidoreductase [Bacteroidales bacterium]